MTAPNKSFRDVRSVINLNKYLNKKVHVKFTGGREVEGTLKGHDAMANLVLDDTMEFLRGERLNLALHVDPNDATRLSGEVRKLGLLVARGTSVIVIHPVEGTEKIENPFVS
ncbi:bifunctional Sm-like protein Lsm7/LSM domain [Babesia duncani]|uniref:Bifunctional Sm-like protein Lsm7/LSM domain n=1 Tax=Babesia duncani TaxID=323732 RepID=A0AAD9PJN3_9APIC|nr:bifunctional Sm-like protein Lsm7/LSM domain [Babesia duncani]